MQIKVFYIVIATYRLSICPKKIKLCFNQNDSIFN